MAKLLKIKDKYIIRNEWDQDDILNEAEGRDIKLSSEELKAVMTLIVSSYDPSLGITWDTIEIATDIVISKRKQTK